MISLDYLNAFFNECLENPSTFVREVLLEKPYWYQDVFFEAIPKYSTIVVLKGRQIGITWACGLTALWFASTHENVKVLILALNLDQAQEEIDHIKGVLRKFSERELAEFGIIEPVYQRGLLATKIHFKNGSLIEAKGCTRPRADNVRSRRADLLIVNEAILLYDSMLSAIEPVTTRGGTTLYVSTAGAEGCYFHRTLEEIKEGKLEDAIFFEFPACKINEKEEIVDVLCPDITKKTLERKRRKLGDLNFKREFCGQWLGETNKIFPMESSYKVGKAINFGGLYYGGLDVGGRLSPSVFHLIKGSREKACLVLRRSWRRGTPYDKIASDLAKTYSKKRFKLVFDQTGVGNAMVQPLRDRAIPNRGISGSRPTKNKLIFNLASALEESLKVPEEYHQTLYELRSYYGEIGKGTSLFNFFSITSDHDVDALALAWEAIPKTRFPRGLGAPQARERRVFG